MQSIIVDSGALVALFDPGNQHRSAVKASLSKAPASVTMMTTWPCVTEATHIVGRVELQIALLAFLRGGRCVVHAFAAKDLDRFMTWMTKYQDRPMDFADASLLWLACETRVADVLTTDCADFETYRLPGGRRFRIL